MTTFPGETLYHLCFWGDSGRIAVGCDRGVRTEHIDSDNDDRQLHDDASRIRSVNLLGVLEIYIQWISLLPLSGLIATIA